MLCMYRNYQMGRSTNNETNLISTLSHFVRNVSFFNENLKKWIVWFLSHHVPTHSLPCFPVPSMASLFDVLQCPSHVVLGQITSLTEILWMRQRVGTAHMGSKQLLLLVFARRSVCQYLMAEENPAAQRQTALTAYLKSNQLLLFGFALHN